MWSTIRPPMSSTRKAPERVRIKDVAHHAGVSIGTVSHVLTGRAQVSESLRARVQGAIDALGYVPNFHAQGLRRSLSRVIGLCFPHVSTAYLQSVSETLETIASSTGYGVLHVFSRHDPATELDRIKELIRYRVDGLVLLPSPSPSVALDLIARKGVPLVIVDRPTRDARFDQVVLDNREAMREVGQRLLALGHRRLLFVCFSRSRLVTQHRIAGLDALRRATPGMVSVRCLEFGGDTALLRSGLAEALQGASPATAIIASNSHQASLVLSALADLKVSCPDDVSMVTFDDPEWSTLVHPPLAVVRQPADAIAQTAWDLLMRRIARKRGPARTVALAATIEFRESVAPVRGARSAKVAGRVVPMARAGARRKA